MGDTLNILIAEPIEQKLLDRLINVFEVARLRHPQCTYTDVRFCISSLGGSVAVGKDIYDLIKALPQPTTMINVGHVASIAASAVFVAASHRQCYSNSTFMIHPTHICLRQVLIAAGYGKAVEDLEKVEVDTWRLNEYNLQQASRTLGLSVTDDDTILLLARETGTNANVFRDVMEANKVFGAETKMTALEALSLNLVDKIIDVG